MNHAAITIWSEDGSETTLFAQMTEYDRDEDTAFYEGTLVLDFGDPSKCSDEAAKNLVGRHINIHFPLANK